MAIDTGHGASITFSSTGGTWLCRQISGPRVTLPIVNASYLGTATDEEKLPGDLNDWGPVTLEILYQGSQGLPARGVVQTITITHPLATGNTTPANLAGTGFITEVEFPNFQTNTMQMGTIVFTFDGYTGPTYTAAS